MYYDVHLDMMNVEKYNKLIDFMAERCDSFCLLNERFYRNWCMDIKTIRHELTEEEYIKALDLQQEEIEQYNRGFERGLYEGKLNLEDEKKLNKKNEIEHYEIVGEWIEKMKKHEIKRVYALQSYNIRFSSDLMGLLNGIELLYYHINEETIKVLKECDDLCNWRISENRLENLVFLKNDKVVLSCCSHDERVFYNFDNEEDRICFEKLFIPGNYRIDKNEGEIELRYRNEIK